VQRKNNMSSGECEHTTRSGARCRATALSKSTLCFDHSQTRDRQRTAAQHPGGENKRWAPWGSVSPEGSFESASEARKFLATIKGELWRAELGPVANAASYAREDWQTVAAEQRRATAFSPPDASDPDQGFKRFLADFQNFAFESDLDHLLFAAHDLARRKDRLTRGELEAWWIAYRGGTGHDGDKPLELPLLFSAYYRARRMRRSARGAKGSRGNRRRSKVK